MSATETETICGTCYWSYDLIERPRFIKCGGCGKHFHKSFMSFMKCGDYTLTCFEAHCYARGAVYKDCKDVEKSLHISTLLDVKPTKTFASYYPLNAYALRRAKEGKD